MFTFKQVQVLAKDKVKVVVSKVKSTDYLSYKHLIKPSLVYLSIASILTSCAMYVTEKNEAIGTQSIPVKFSESPKNPTTAKPITQKEQISKLQKGTDLYNQFWCLRALGWNEIRNGDKYAIEAVYSVVENRKNSGVYPSDYCKIMKQQSQFSFWNAGKYNVLKVEPKPQTKEEIKALNHIEKVSLKMVTGNFNPVLPKNILWYSTPAAKKQAGKNHWTNKFVVATQAGPHLFYREPV